MTTASSEAGARMDKRVLRPKEKAILNLALSHEPSPGAAALRPQVDLAIVTSGQPTFLDLEVPRELQPADVPDGPLRVRMFVRDPDTATYQGEILVWVANGYLSAVEYAWFSEGPPSELPPPERLIVVAQSS